MRRVKGAVINKPKKIPTEKKFGRKIDKFSFNAILERGEKARNGKLIDCCVLMICAIFSENVVDCSSVKKVLQVERIK